MKVFVLAIGLSAALGGAAFAGGRTFVVRPAMQQDINTATIDIWDVGNHAMDDAGGIDPKLIDAAGWARLEDAAAKLQAEALRMQQAETIRAAPPGEAGEVELGAFSLADVQRYIDADPAAFRAMAGALADHARRLKRAAHDRDAATAGNLVGGLEGVCEACHAKYWYPQG